MPTVDDVILMKIAAGNRTPNDQNDLRALWPSASFATPRAAVDAFSEAYPLEDSDTYLADWMADIVAGERSHPARSGCPLRTPSTPEPYAIDHPHSRR